MAILLGPVEDIGYPFDGQRHEIPRRRVIGDTIVYSFGRPFLYERVSIEPEEPIEAIALWDPMWLRVDPDRSGEWQRIQALAAEHKAPVVGILGDWFAGWRAQIAPEYQTPALLELLSGVVTDEAGAATILSVGFRGPVVGMRNMLSYGRLPTLGNDPNAVADAAVARRREMDVCCVCYPHGAIVWQRPFYFDLVRRICRERGWTCVIRDRVSVGHMESLYLRSRVVFNCSLGSQLNMRVYEALACGCHLLTDGWNLEADTLPPGVQTYTSPDQVEAGLSKLLNHPPDATEALPWVLAHGPVETWKRIIRAIRMAAIPAGYSPHGRAAISARCSSQPKYMERLPPKVPSR